MRGAVIDAPGDVEVIDRDKPTIEKPTDAIIKVVAACVCGSDMWPWRGIEHVPHAFPMGHEYVGIVDEIGDEIENIEIGEFVIGSFMASDNTCKICKSGYQSHCQHVEYVGMNGAQAEYLHRPARAATSATSASPTASSRRSSVPVQVHVHVHLHGGPAPVRQYLPELIDLIWTDKINPGRVFDLEVGIEDIAEGYKAMDERRASKAIVRIQPHTNRSSGGTPPAGGPGLEGHSSMSSMYRPPMTSAKTQDATAKISPCR